MAEGFEAYHVPQQSRRDKLRVVNHHPPGCVDSLQTCAALVPLYEPSLIPPDFINCATLQQRQSYNLAAAGVKEEGVNFMGFSGGMGANHMYADPQHLSVHLNPSTIHDIYASYRGGGVFDQPFHGGGDAPATPSGAGQSLSLSLSSHHSNLPLELNLQRYDSPVFSGGKVSEGYLVSCNGGAGAELSKSSVPLGPFTGYASVLKGSRFLKPAQQLLEELCDVGRGIYSEKSGADSSLLDPPPLESFSGSEIVDDSVANGDQTRKKSRLLSMLDEVYKRYKQYYQQMQAAVAAFESVAGLSGAAPFANLALKAMSKHFRSLKNAITDQLHFTSKSHGKINVDRDETQRLENSGRGSYGQRPFHAGFADQPVWRPQRGLPERAVTVLRAWLFEHFLHPYPTDTDKLMLAKQTGLSRNQVSNWFINARVRLWKPMVEEIHMLETRQSQKGSQREEGSDHLPTSCSVEGENASTSIQRSGDFPLKRCREDPTEAPGGGVGQQMKMPYDNLLHNPHHNMGAGLSSGGGGSSGVSLTLGLHQNGVGLPDSYPLNAARRFGLDSHGESYVVSGFAAQNRQFGRDIIDGQIMHDFVG
ncbi:BEL1-like homeodomain protein 9 [Salvia miltiorrhiza]|uniref:BEL1-like homeodomain protein 9 n=1 Tax=Salvia miltiorrhiza TaxID=226208 RepID=UPI0025AC23C1|nr:BEL1-like homeodomain protein 9 [Salvia miltiorrhiza]